MSLLVAGLLTVVGLLGAHHIRKQDAVTGPSMVTSAVAPQEPLAEANPESSNQEPTPRVDALEKKLDAFIHEYERQRLANIEFANRLRFDLQKSQTENGTLRKAVERLIQE